MPSKFLTAVWENLVMANYSIDPHILEPYIPYGTKLDYFNGKAYVSLVGFMFKDTRVLGLRIPFHVNFQEVNLRFYVRHHDGKAWKRGTVFIKEIVPRLAISVVANTLYNEKYVTKRMKHATAITGDEMYLSYLWKHRQRWNRIEATVENRAVPMEPGSETEFIAEHYWGYSRYDAQTTFEYNVQHPSWHVYHVRSAKVDCDFASLYGENFKNLNDLEPDSILVAAGSPISIMQKRRL